MDAEWSSEIGVTNIICITDPEDLERPESLLKAKVKKDGVDPKTSIYWVDAENKEHKDEHDKMLSSTGALVVHGNTAAAAAAAAENPTPNKKWEPLHVVCPVENDDDDRTPESWNNLSKALPIVMPHFLRLLKVRKFLFMLIFMNYTVTHYFFLLLGLCDICCTQKIELFFSFLICAFVLWMVEGWCDDPCVRPHWRQHCTGASCPRKTTSREGKH